jgi:hypothetical protein
MSYPKPELWVRQKLCGIDFQSEQSAGLWQINIIWSDFKRCLRSADLSAPWFDLPF